MLARQRMALRTNPPSLIGSRRHGSMAAQLGSNMRALMCPVELEIFIGLMKLESVSRRAEADEKKKEQEASASAGAAAGVEACLGPVEDLVDLDFSSGSAPISALIAASPIEDFIDLDLSCGSTPIADAWVPSPAFPRVELPAGKVVEAAEEVGVLGPRLDFAEVVDCPTAGEMDVVPSPLLFDFGETNLLEVEDGGAMDTDSGYGSDGGDRGFKSSCGNIGRRGLVDLVEDVPLSLDFGEIYLLEVADDGATDSESSYGGSGSCSSSSDTGEEAANDDGYPTGHNGGKRLPGARKEGTVWVLNRPFDRGKVSGFLG